MYLFLIDSKYNKYDVRLHFAKKATRQGKLRLSLVVPKSGDIRSLRDQNNQSYTSLIKEVGNRYTHIGTKISSNNENFEILINSQVSFTLYGWETTENSYWILLRWKFETIASEKTAVKKKWWLITICLGRNLEIYLTNYEWIILNS